MFGEHIKANLRWTNEGEVKQIKGATNRVQYRDSVLSKKEMG